MLTLYLKNIGFIGVFTLAGACLFGQQITNFNLSSPASNQIDFTWQTVDEFAWCYFVIEGDTSNTQVFVPLYTTNAIGTTSGVNNYLFSSFNPDLVNSSYCFRITVWDDINFDSLCEIFGQSDTNCIITGTEPITASPLLHIYPNPSTREIMIQSNKPIEYISITNMLAEQVVEIKPESNHTYKLGVDISVLTGGMYFITVQGPHYTTTRQIIKR
jgi:hypothetical protein